jgi:FMN phosphatase YigB (HAD superfamily)
MHLATKLIRLCSFIACIGALPALSEEASVYTDYTDDWLFFDLGEVIVTGTPTDGYHYTPGVLEYLQAARTAGYKLALLTNIPETWGLSCAEKFTALQEFLGLRLQEETVFNWKMFDAVVMPPFDRYRKPHRLMFLHALSLGCNGRALFVGESPSEVSTATDIGFATYTVPPDASTPLPSLNQINGILSGGFHFQYPAACNFEPLIASVLLPEDIASGPQGFAGCTVTP